ncbi:MBL fold metallo-hydrolase [Tepidibacter sp. Z1-5]|uniref:MBL fold metallo-hydrolase n=1 Tax=Tepidibacter sp. Z1-5 TaxID=3134138 RepID=UPI0030BE4770
MIIEMFPARNGDAFLIRLDNKKNILVDMGYIDTYKSNIRDSLQKINNENQCIDLLIITHIDEDHIEGAIEFLKENGESNNPNIIEIKEIWYNSYKHLQFDKVKVDNISRFEKKQLEEIKLSNSGISKNETNESNLVSARQGSTLAGYLYALGYVDKKWNTSFDFEAVNLDTSNKIELDDIVIYILSPDTNKLKSLSKLWNNKLKKIDIDFSISDEKIFDDAYEMYMKKIKPIIDVNESNNISYGAKSFEIIVNEEIKQSKKDTSKSNGGSISFILEYKDKKVLFLGDAHEDIIMENLEKYKDDGKTLRFNAVKISHHGSIKNNFNWIENVKAKKYLISTNGEKHNHPNKEVIAKILQCNKEKKTLYFNYPLDICNDINKNMLQENYNYSIVIGNGTSSLQIEVDDKDE